jgi:DNA repair exonuclease SbcCD ATPase subunit
MKYILAKEIADLRQQVRELTELLDCVKSERDQQLADAEALRVCADHDANELAKQLAECQTSIIQQAEQLTNEQIALARTIEFLEDENKKLHDAVTESKNEFTFHWEEKLAECQAREKVLRDALQQCAYDEEGYCINPDAAEALDEPSDSTALDDCVKEAKREALLDAAEYCDNQWRWSEGEYQEYEQDVGDGIRRMAKELE